jgi:hypothetical protein
MSKYVPIRFNDEEARVLDRSFAASDDAGLGTHIKRVYFDAVKLNVGVLQEIRADLDRIGGNLERLRGSDVARTDPEMLLSILCGLYVMVRKSVGDSIRAQADQALDVDEIERYLKGR